MRPFTASDRREIDRAYSALLRIVESSHSAENTLRAAYKYERRERSSQTLTQALLVESFLDGWHNKYSVADLFTLADGCADATILGAYYAKQRPDRVTEADLALLHGAHERHMASIREKVPA